VYEFIITGAIHRFSGIRVLFPLGSYLNIEVFSTVALALIAALSWMATVSKLELSRVNPFTDATLTFVSLLCRVIFDGEPS
jgi:hypothetical protein